MKSQLFITLHTLRHTPSVPGLQTGLGDFYVTFLCKILTIAMQLTPTGCNKESSLTRTVNTKPLMNFKMLLLLQVFLEP